MCLVDYELVQLEKRSKTSTTFQPLQSNTLSEVSEKVEMKKIHNKNQR